MTDYEYIKKRLPEAEILAQLAEEAAELSQAALKLRRALRGINPTPVSEDEAWEKLVEEAADVELSVCMAGVCPLERHHVMERKTERWAKRLRERHEAAD